jgi:hypothetical protein
MLLRTTNMKQELVTNYNNKKYFHFRSRRESKGQQDEEDVKD